jgi:hypothetical protein
MNVHEYIRDFAYGAEVQLESRDVSRIASALKTAGFRGEMSERDQELAQPLIATRIGKIVGASPSKVRTAEAAPAADAEVEKHKDAAAFEKIDAMVKQGKCARCGKLTTKIHLAEYEEMNFCQECRTVLW